MRTLDEFLRTVYSDLYEASTRFDTVDAYGPALYGVGAGIHALMDLHRRKCARPNGTGRETVSITEQCATFLGPELSAELMFYQYCTTQPDPFSPDLPPEGT